jgi:outer membrane immunogenic protein
MIYRNSNFGRVVGRLGLIGASVASLVVPASAADMPVKAPPPTVTWDGVYLGGSIGWEQTDTNWTTTCFTASGICPDTEGVVNSIPGPFPVDASSPHNFSTSGARYGGFFGVNWQILPAWVVGVEADAAWMNQSSRIIGLVGCTISCETLGGTPITGNPAGDSTRVGTDWDGSFRARAGYLFTPAVLLYGTAGLAVQQSTAGMSCVGGTVPAGGHTSTGSPWCGFNQGQAYVNRVQTGWTAGGGIEYRAWGNWFVRGEYRYSGYQSWSPVFFQGTQDEVHANLSSHGQMAIFGVSYLFGGTPVRNN